VTPVTMMVPTSRTIRSMCASRSIRGRQHPEQCPRAPGVMTYHPPHRHGHESEDCSTSWCRPPTADSRGGSNRWTDGAPAYTGGSQSRSDAPLTFAVRSEVAGVVGLGENPMPIAKPSRDWAPSSPPRAAHRLQKLRVPWPRVPLTTEGLSHEPIEIPRGRDATRGLRVSAGSTCERRARYPSTSRGDRSGSRVSFGSRSPTIRPCSPSR
jgi:hypothetical protein